MLFVSERAVSLMKDPSSLGIDMQGYFNSQAFFKGQISNVMIFNKTLTDQELIEFYDYGPFEAPNTIPEFPSWNILPLILAVTLLLIILERKLHNVKVS